MATSNHAGGSTGPKRIEIPAALREVLLEFSVAYLLEQPDDIVEYALDYFEKLKDNRQTTQDDGDDEDVPPVQYSRRKSVFAEPFDPEADDSDDEQGAPAIFPKSDEQRHRLSESVKNVILFKSLEKEQMNQVLDAMFERKVSPGDYIIRQGDDGDNFYVIESGVYKVYKDDVHVHTYDNSGIFGELALLYNMPRAATVEAETEGLLWAMDRQTFRRILLKSAFKRRKMYEELLDSVPLLKTLQPYERMNLADALITKRFSDQEIIIKQGDSADGMYFIEEGEVSIRKEDENGKEVELAVIGKGAFFGELALVTHKPRAASVYANGEVKTAFLETESFERILGPSSELLRQQYWS